jgi:hypothetical protein
VRFAPCAHGASVSRGGPPSVGCVIVGFCLGVWFGFFFEYQPSPRLRVIGCPVPVVCFVLQKSADGKEQWTDFMNGFMFASSSVGDR